MTANPAGRVDASVVLLVVTATEATGPTAPGPSYATPSRHAIVGPVSDRTAVDVDPAGNVAT
jgi:hypothetical protein